MVDEVTGSSSLSSGAAIEGEDPALLHDRRRVLALLRRHGRNATSFQVLEPGFRYWFDDEDACVAYVDTGRAWVVGGEPIASIERMHETARRFVRAARARGRRACFFAVEERFAEQTDFPSLRIGEQPAWRPEDWETALKGSRSLREQVRRARAKGVTVRAVSPEELRDGDGATRMGMERVVRRWLGSRQMAPMGFLVQIHLDSFPDERRHFVAELDGLVVGLLAVVPIYARGGWFLEDLLRDPEAAPNGTAELLIDGAMRAAAEEGVCHLTLGLAPLAGTVNRWLRFARRWGARLYDFEGVRAFKEKLRPRAWEPVFLAYPPESNAVAATYDALAAFARGGLRRFGIETLLRGPAIVVRLLAALLVPWTILLALVDVKHFPAEWVRWAWVGFDVGLAAALFSLTRRWRPRLASVLATLVTLDAVVTFGEALAWNARRARTAWEWIATVLAVLAPSSAAFLLWRARSHRRQVAGHLADRGEAQP